MSERSQSEKRTLQLYVCVCVFRSLWLGHPVVQYLHTIQFLICPQHCYYIVHDAPEMRLYILSVLSRFHCEKFTHFNFFVSSCFNYVVSIFVYNVQQGLVQWSALGIINKNNTKVSPFVWTKIRLFNSISLCGNAVFLGIDSQFSHSINS